MTKATAAAVSGLRPALPAELLDRVPFFMSSFRSG
jgi:hypothetical protein